MEERTVAELVIGILSAVKEPVSTELLADFSGLKPGVVEAVIRGHTDKIVGTGGRFIAKPEVIKTQGDLTWAHKIISEKALSALLDDGESVVRSR